MPVNADQREALVLTVVGGQSYEQVAQHAGVSGGTIKSRVSRARDTLERLLLGGEEAVTAQRPTWSRSREARNGRASSETRVVD